MVSILAVYFEEGRYDDCIALCLKAVDVGREHRADYALIAKYIFYLGWNYALRLRAYARIATSYMKQNKLKEALQFYEKSLSEHRDPEVVKKHKEVEKAFKEEQRVAYINPEISEEEKNKGNELFKKGYCLRIFIFGV